MADLEAQGENQKQPLLSLAVLSQNQKSQAQKVISQTFQSTTHLANLLPARTVLAFQILSPILAYQGQCTSANRFIKTCLLGMCILSCFILSFSDSFQDSSRYVQCAAWNDHFHWFLGCGQPRIPSKGYSKEIQDKICRLCPCFDVSNGCGQPRIPLSAQ